MVSSKGVSKDKFKTEARSMTTKFQQVKPNVYSSFQFSENDKMQRSSKSSSVKMHNKKITKHPVISDFFMKELSDDLIKCNICKKDIPIFFQQGHATICQSEVNSSLNQNKTANKFSLAQFKFLFN